jgi:hypothetical protein
LLNRTLLSTQVPSAMSTKTSALLLSA